MSSQLTGSGQDIEPVLLFPFASLLHVFKVLEVIIHF